MECTRCNGLGYIELEDGTNKMCTCKVSESIKLALAPIPNILMAKKKNIQLERFSENMFINIKNLNTLYSILKTVFTYYFLKDVAKTMDLIDSDTIMEAYFGSNDYYSLATLKESEFLVITIEEGNINKILPDVIKSMVTYRKEVLSRPTWIAYHSSDGNKMDKMTKFSNLVQYLNTAGFKFISVVK